MNFSKNPHRRKLFLKIALLALLFFMLPNLTFGANTSPGYSDYSIHSLIRDPLPFLPGASQLFSIGDIVGGAIGWIAFIVNYLITVIVGLFIAIVTYVIGIVLQLNGNVMNALAVKSGFQVTLALANLGFVLGIIIIAIATILQRETYGIKKTLWKLVVAAILVNFSLVIGGVIINFANQLTLMFMAALPGTGGGLGTSNTSWSGLSFPFADALSGAFAPHRSLLIGFDGVNATSTTGGVQSSTIFANGGSSNLGSSLASVITPIFSIAFTAFMLITILIVLVVFCFMLLIRYVFLTILLILMPLAWLMWLFPKTSHLWSKWWDNFFRWTFFAPIVMFFLYLAIATAGAMSAANAVGNANDPAAGLSALGYQSAGNVPIIGAASSALGGFLNTLTGQFLQMFVIVGLAVGGMIAADKMSIMGASAAISGVKAVGNKTKGWAWDQTKKGGRWAARKSGVEEAARRMRSANVNIGAGKLKGVPVAGKVAAGAEWLVNRGASLTGRAIQPHLNNEDLVEKARKAVPKDTDKIKENLLGNMNMQDIIAHIDELRRQNKLTDDVMVGKKTIKEFMNENEDVIKKSYGQVKMVDDAGLALGGDKAMRTAEKEINELAKAGKDTTAAMKKLNDATENFVAKMEKGDVNKINANGVFGKDTVLSQALARRFALSAPQLVASILPKMKSANLRTFDNMYRRIIDDEVASAYTSGDMATVNHLAGRKMVKGKNVLSQDSVLGRYNRSYGHNATSSAGAGGGTPPTTGTP